MSTPLKWFYGVYVPVSNVNVILSPPFILYVKSEFKSKY